MQYAPEATGTTPPEYVPDEEQVNVDVRPGSNVAAVMAVQDEPAYSVLVEHREDDAKHDVELEAKL